VLVAATKMYFQNFVLQTDRKLGIAVSIAGKR
jgi:hypothetical protein